MMLEIVIFKVALELICVGVHCRILRSESGGWALKSAHLVIILCQMVLAGRVGQSVCLSLRDNADRASSWNREVERLAIALGL